jgi:hypothetical protein
VLQGIGEYDFVPPFRMPSRERVAALIRASSRLLIRSLAGVLHRGRDDAGERQAPPRVGLKNLVAHERGVMAAFKEIRTLPVKTWLVDGDNVVISWVFEFTRPNGTQFRMDELALQRWRGDGSQRALLLRPAQLAQSYHRLKPPRTFCSMVAP